MKTTKLVPVRSYAFDAEKEMEKLARLAKEGWVLHSLAFGGFAFKLKKQAPQNVVYSVDLQTNCAKIADLEEYYEIHRSGGWDLVCSDNGMINIFKAPLGTPPVHTDKEILREVYTEDKKVFGKSLLIFLGVTLLLLLSIQILRNWAVPPLLLTLLQIGATVSTAIFAINLVVFLAYTERAKRGDAGFFSGKKGFAVMLLACAGIGLLVGFFI